MRVALKVARLTSSAHRREGVRLWLLLLLLPGHSHAWHGRREGIGGRVAKGIVVLSRNESLLSILVLVARRRRHARRVATMALLRNVPVTTRRRWVGSRGRHAMVAI